MQSNRNKREEYCDCFIVIMKHKSRIFFCSRSKETEYAWGALTKINIGLTMMLHETAH